MGHLFVPRDQEYAEISDAINESFRQAGLNLLLETCPEVRPEVLGRGAIGKSARLLAVSWIQ